jgi:two-component system sensor histidine kinase ArlS
MPVRLRITILFTLMVFVVLGIVCSSIYYFSYKSRRDAIWVRLSNRAITTARLLSKSEIFDRQLIQRIDSLTTLALKNKSVQAYNELDKRIYNYSDIPGDTVAISKDILDKAQAKSSGHYFEQGDKEVVAYYYTDPGFRVIVVCAATDEDGKKNLLQLRAILVSSFLLGIFIAAIGGYFFSRRLLMPIKGITQEVTEITAQNLARRIPTGTVKDEWYKMADTLNELLNRLQESFELQRRFISNASHELSTPLTAISSQLEIALQRKRTPEEFEKIIAEVRQDVQRMSKLTQTLLEFAKAAGNKGGLTINLVRIDEILMETPAILQKQNNQYDVFLEFGALPENEDDLLVFGNADLLSVAITNIVANACKYSADHRAVVSFLIEDKHFVIAVADKGEGIPPEELEKIFQPFYRVDSVRSSAGFGLGLSLAYRIIKLHKGDITVNSEPGKGTVFTVRIPSAKKAAI